MLLLSLRERIDVTPFVDTHEHLLEERTRLAGPGAHRLQSCDAGGLFFPHSAGDDLWPGGMPADKQQRFFAPDVAPADKGAIVEPHWRRARHTGYLRAVGESIHRL